MQISGFLSSRGYDVDTAVDGKEALEKFQKIPSQIVITDIEMPVMGGYELISHLNEVEFPPVIFVTTSHKNPELIIEIMKKGVFDFILKPVDMSDLMLRITRAFETYDMRRALEVSQREKVIRLEHSLEWYKFEERLKSKDVKSLGKNIFESLLVSFSQGSGFGTLLTLISVMRVSAVKDGDVYRIRSDLFDTIMENVGAAEKALSTFSEMAELSSVTHPAEKVTLSALHDAIEEKVAALKTAAGVRGHMVSVSEKKEFFSDVSIMVSVVDFLRVFEEVVFNALKFSPASSRVVVIVQKHENRCAVSVINDAAVSDTGVSGIPVGFENLVFEPFYRLTKSVNEDYQTLDYGLGLSLVEKLVTKDGGTVEIGNIIDYSDVSLGPKVKVECTVSFPIFGA